MRMNNKGFSLIELMAVLVITTIILVPLLSGLSDAYNANQRAQQRSNALNIAEGALYALEKIDYSEFDAIVNPSTGSTDYVEFNQDNCDTFSASSNEKICGNIFSQVWNNEVYDSSTFRIFVFNFKITNTQYTNIIANVPSEVSAQVTEIFCPGGVCSFIPEDSEDEVYIPSLKRVIVWVQYFENPDKAIILEGMLTNEKIE